MAKRRNRNGGGASQPPKPPKPIDGGNQKPEPGEAPIAPWPSLDKYPIVLGSNLTLAYLSSVYRLSQTGYRREYVDALDELLERDPHCYAVLAQRIFAVAGGRFGADAAQCDETEHEKALEIARAYEQCMLRIPDLRQALASLLWAIFYGVSANEIGWYRDGQYWGIERLYWIHSRRLNYPDPSSWSVRIWDLGFVYGWEGFGMQGQKGPGSLAGYGIPADDYPGKFITHAPQLRGDYPTRDGLGRELAYWMAIKGMAARGAAQYVERFGKPWPIATFTTGDPDTDGKPRAATNEDINIANAAIQGVGAGNLGGAVLPDSIDVEMLGPGAAVGNAGKLVHVQFIELCDAQESKTVLGQTDTTTSNTSGSRAKSQVSKKGTIELYRYDAACLCDTLKRDTAYWFTHLNYPGLEHLTPTPRIYVDEDPSADELAPIALVAVQCGLPVDADKLADKLGIPLIEDGDTKARRAAWVKQIDPSEIDETIEPPPPPIPPKLPGATPPNGKAKDANATEPPTGPEPN